jgi:dihydroceramidase
MYKYWGDFDSSVIFCEDKYTHSYYVAEYFNTLSGIAYLLVAYYFLTTKIIHYGFLITLMGLGTMTLHGTLRWYGQWADEMSMLTLMFFYIKDVYYDIKYEYCSLLLGIYMTFHDNYGVFLLLFVSLIFYQYKAAQQIIRNKNAKYYLRVYQISMISGGVCWILDRVCFTKVVNFHVLWHLLSTIGVYSGTQIYHEHRKDLDKAANKILQWYKNNN